MASLRDVLLDAIWELEVDVFTIGCQTDMHDEVEEVLGYEEEAVRTAWRWHVTSKLSTEKAQSNLRYGWRVAVALASLAKAKFKQPISEIEKPGQTTLVRKLEARDLLEGDTYLVLCGFRLSPEAKARLLLQDDGLPRLPSRVTYLNSVHRFERTTIPFDVEVYRDSKTVGVEIPLLAYIIGSPKEKPIKVKLLASTGEDITGDYEPLGLAFELRA